MAVQGDLAHRLMGIANRQGRTVYSLTNEIVEQAIEADLLDCPLKDIVEFYRLLRVEKDSGSVIIRKDNLLYMIDKLYPREKKVLWDKWYRSGRWYGKYLQVKFLNGEQFGVLEKLLDACAWDSSEFRLQRDGDNLVLNSVSLASSLEYTELVARFLEGIVHSLGYETTNNDITRGLIVLEFKKGNSS